jgi:predicted kinase
MSERRLPLYVVCGPPACGKSVYGRCLAERVGGAFIDSDTATEQVVQAGLRMAGFSPDDRDSAVYKEQFRTAVYETLFALAEENLGHMPVVLAGPFTRESQDVDWRRRLEDRFGTTVEVHFVWLDSERRRGRMRVRGAERDLAKLEDWEAYLRTCATDPPPFEHVLVDGADGTCR